MQTSIEKVNFWRLDQPAEFIAAPGREATHEKEFFQDAQVFVHRFTVQVELPTNLAQIHQPKFLSYPVAGRSGCGKFDCISVG